MGSVLCIPCYGRDWHRVRNLRDDEIAKMEQAHKAHLKRWARVTSVYDGDTFTACLRDTDGKMRLFRCRCAGYDSPEMRPRKNVAHREEQIAAAKAAKAFLEAQLLGRCFHMHTEGLDKYGRILVRIKLKLGWMDEVMVQSGHAVRYDGGTKAAFDSKSSALVRPVAGTAEEAEA